MAQNKVVPTKSAVATVGAVGNVSLHSSNDSGFSNEPPPQPDVDYSDEEAQRLRVPIRYNSFHYKFQNYSCFPSFFVCLLLVDSLDLSFALFL